MQLLVLSIKVISYYPLSRDGNEPIVKESQGNKRCNGMSHVVLNTVQFLGTIICYG